MGFKLVEITESISEFDNPKKVYTVYTFVNQVLRCSGLVYSQCSLFTPNQRPVLSDAAPIQQERCCDEDDVMVHDVAMKMT